MAELFGIENLKKLVKFSLDLAEQIEKSTKDGWQWLSDTLSFVDELSQIPGVAKSWPAILVEFKDLSKEERAELYEYAQDNFDIEDDKVEFFVEDALLNAASLISLISRFKELKNPPATP